MMWECARYRVLFTVSINIECRRAWLPSAGSYQRGVNIFCVFFLRCGNDKEIGDSPALAERLSQVTCPSTKSPANFYIFLFTFLNRLCTFYSTASHRETCCC